MYTLGLSSFDALLQKNKLHLEKEDADHYVLPVYFGTCQPEALQRLARQLFGHYPCPILEIHFKRSGEHWRIETLRTRSIHNLTKAQENDFATALDSFSRKVWKRSRTRRQYSYDLAILMNPEEKMPPSSAPALKNFIRAGRRMGIDVELITKKDYTRLAEYDALFIRETTAVDHHTYRFAQKAEFEQMPVIDDPGSILRCANKIYLAERLRDNELPTPRTVFLYCNQPESLQQAADELQFPLVLKIPDGAFSRGVHKVVDMADLIAKSTTLFQSSVLLLAQEYMYTEFDWRIGVLDGKALFACRYYMSSGHWQIYNHSAVQARDRSGRFDTLAVEQAPADAIKLAENACDLVGQSLYGVDIKQTKSGFAVIEINDNPNIDANIEDKHLGFLMYHRIMEHFFRKLELCRYGNR
jgi:glutathione synthase/RimK-type ligase-like ATP-grasp enzyme